MPTDPRAASAQTTAPTAAPIYCNPLSLPLAAADAAAPGRGGKPHTQSLADPTVIKHEGKYYLYATGGAAWVSADLVHWAHHAVSFPDQGRLTAPSLVEHKGTFYAIGNGCIMYKSKHPLGPWESLGHVVDETGQTVHWADWMLFLDDGVMYAYHNSDKGIGTDGIFVTRLDPKAEFARTLGPTTNCLAFNPEHVWERRGEKNEIADQSWIEAPWLTKHAGKYYLQYSAPGTEYTNYAVGVYVGDSPVGPFAYQPSSPILLGKGFLNGTGHHAVIDGPDGQLWVLYHVLVGNESTFERRLALDRVVFDAAGNMTMPGPSDLPQWSPLAKQRGDAGLVNLATGGAASSDTPAAAGHGPENALDKSMRTWWEPATAGAPHSLTVDLVQTNSVQAVRTVFYHPGPFQYTLEGSLDGKEWNPLATNGKSALAECNCFDVFAPTRARYVRITLANKPAQTPLRVLDFAIFGRPREH